MSHKPHCQSNPDRHSRPGCLHHCRGSRCNPQQDRCFQLREYHLHHRNQRSTNPDHNGESPREEKYRRDRQLWLSKCIHLKQEYQKSPQWKRNRERRPMQEHPQQHHHRYPQPNPGHRRHRDQDRSAQKPSAKRRGHPADPQQEGVSGCHCFQY